MPGDQWSQLLIDLTFGFRVLSSWKSHENVVQGHLLTLGLGAKNQTEHQYYMSLALTGVYGQCRHGNTTKTGMVEVEVFSELTHQCESCIKGNCAKP